MKLVEIVQVGRERGTGRMMEGVNPTKIHFKHIGKYPSLSLCTIIMC
jgi:hypothetical protein